MNSKQAASADTPPKLWSAKYIILIMVNTFSAFSFYLISTIMTKYLVGLGTTLTLAGVIMGIFSITALIVRPISGLVSDHFNKKYIVMISTFMIGVSVLGYAFTKNIAVLMAFRILHGIAFGISGTAIVALSSEYIPQKRMGEGIGYLGLGLIIGAAVAPGLGIMITEKYNYSITFFCSFLMASVAASLLFLFQTDVKVVHPVREDIRNWKLRTVLKSLIVKEAITFSVIAGLFSFINGVVTSFLLLYADQRHVQNIGWYFTVSAIVMFLIRPFSGKIMDKKGLSLLMYPAFAIGIIAMVLHGLATALWIFLLGSVLKAAAQGCIQPSLQAESLKRAGEGRSGVATSTFYIGGDVGQGIGPIVGGIIGSVFNYSVMFYFCAFLAFVSGLLYFIKVRVDKRSSVENPTGSDRKSVSQNLSV